MKLSDIFFRLPPEAENARGAPSQRHPAMSMEMDEFSKLIYRL